MAFTSATIKINSIHIRYKSKSHSNAKDNAASDFSCDLAVRSMSQKEMVFNYMKAHGSITQIDAIRDLGCTRLGARIWDLVHEDGIRIGRDMVKGVNRFGKPTAFARYWLES